MSSNGSGSEDGRYQPILAERIRTGAHDSPATSGVQWPVDAVNVYNNELFTDEQEQHVARQQQQQRPGSSNKMQQAKSTAAARRAERLRAGLYQSNDNMSRAAGAQTPKPPSAQPSQATDQQRLPHDNGNHVYGLGGMYDPNAGPDVYDGQHMHQAVPRPPPPPAWDLSDLASFLMQPGPREGMPAMCYIVRDSNSARMVPKYNLYFEDPKTFLLAARKRSRQTTSNYLVSLDPDDLNRDSEKFYGKVRANFVGTEFTVFDGGAKPGKGGQEAVRRELGAVTYQYNVLGTRGPRKMTGVIPALDGHGRSLFNPATEEDSLLDRLKSNSGLDQVVVMRNKPPRWNEELNAYCLNFSGRVTEASVKNFQLVTDDEPNHIILQFGKIGKNTFTMDYMWPISAFQAFSICLSSFDNKLACE